MSNFKDNTPNDFVNAHPGAKSNTGSHRETTASELAAHLAKNDMLPVEGSDAPRQSGQRTGTHRSMTYNDLVSRSNSLEANQPRCYSNAVTDVGHLPRGYRRGDTTSALPLGSGGSPEFRSGTADIRL